MNLTREQRQILQASQQAKTFLSGPAGCGKTTVGVEALGGLLAAGNPADSILVLTPQRTLQEPYETALRDPSIGPGGQVTLATVGGLARRLVDLFWPLAAAPTGFAHPDQPPVFLTLETAQYYMARLVRPLLDEGFFASVTIDRNRLYSQILDNLNKSAAVGFPHTEIGERLTGAWIGDPGQRRVYADAQECASRFRQYCLEHNLLDFSLQLEIFSKVLWRAPDCRAYLARQYHHLIWDNLEEDIPAAHDLLAEWLAEFDSALLIYDSEAGYRRFLGADPESALRLRALCNQVEGLSKSFVFGEPIASLNNALVRKIAPETGVQGEAAPEALEALVFPPADSPTRFYPQMLEWVADEIQALLKENVPPAEIVVLSPFLSDSLRFSLSTRLTERGIPWRSHRPSRSLRDEPASHCLLTLAELAHPAWGIHPTKFDVAYAFLYAIEGMDLVRAQLLAEIVYRPRDLALSGFGPIRSEVQERITFVFGQHYELLRAWLADYRSTQVEPLDHFLRRLFGEILSQPGFGFHRNHDGARTAASLIESIQKFRQAMEGSGDPPIDTGREYLAMLQDGVIAAQYVEAWPSQPGEAVLLAPAHTFLMMNRPATVQFWLDVGSNGWWERLFQPLTQPYVLSRAWERGRLWTQADEEDANRQTLARLAGGLLRRCRERVYLGLCDLGESGFEQRGPLLKSIWKIQLENQFHEN
ncbi:MAG TPA: UvrD-helicase domain-containing protein [Anaerolineales bacterium]|nr:UvrD-helicase domain-containing protein [Anaerolineales bacterium]